MATKIVTVCDICGKECVMASYQLTLKTMFRTERMDICPDCIREMKEKAKSGTGRAE